MPMIECGKFIVNLADDFLRKMAHDRAALKVENSFDRAVLRASEEQGNKWLRTAEMYDLKTGELVGLEEGNTFIYNYKNGDIMERTVSNDGKGCSGVYTVIHDKNGKLKVLAERDTSKNPQDLTLSYDKSGDVAEDYTSHDELLNIPLSLEESYLLSNAKNSIKAVEDTAKVLYKY